MSRGEIHEHKAAPHHSSLPGYGVELQCIESQLRFRLESPDVDALLEEVFADGLPTECDVLKNTDPEDFGLTRDEVVERFEAVLPLTVYDFLARPVRTEFECKADEL